MHKILIFCKETTAGVGGGVENIGRISKNGNWAKGLGLQIPVSSSNVEKPFEGEEKEGS